ncbi:ribosome-binding factor A [Candidatus Falkowbacteria bacterium CG10_big_fil_rev_8_21_14_0_10_43_10]|uniref:Ribosome-binding factor A n=1 Tax=Candidatus Falkowbacteria bacterium CG10_big_fil_rev_8_21_14_0_10_43_10 TaxID=1974567 RepID=A0A2H0V4K5_9BACT|nr:MAG: ribosome-binding factor A [Candidatus Falkowbacteria bacterium CG10_big_fil_rev_8_21_14_0_10_43_10]
MPKRIEQINELLRKEIALAIERDVELPDILATVTKVECLPELSEAKVWISILPDNRAGSGLQGLRRQQGLIYNALKKNTVLRRIPKLNFIFDNTEKNVAEIYKIISDFKS